MRTDEVQFMLEYDNWANERLLDTIESLSNEEFTSEVGPGHAIPRATILHCINGLRSWRERFLQENGVASGPATEADYPTLASARALWQTEHALLADYVAGADLGSLLELRRGDVVVGIERWQAVVHLTFHNMQHRSELAESLTLFGHSPGEIGMVQFFRERAQGEQPNR